MNSVAAQVGFWDGSVAVVRLQPGSAPLPSTTAAPGEEGVPLVRNSPDREIQHDMVLLTHFQVDPSPLRAVAWCPPQVKTLPPPPSSMPTILLLLLPTGTGTALLLSAGTIACLTRARK